MPSKPRLLPLVLTLAGCSPVSEASSLSFTVDDERGALVGVQGGSSASGVQVEVEWAMEIDNRSPQPCAVAVYRWVEAGPEPNMVLPTASAVEDWPATWEGGELIEVGVVEGQSSTALTLGPAQLEAQEELTGARLGLAVCPDAHLDVGVRAEVTVDLGARTVSEAVLLELWLLR